MADLKSIISSSELGAMLRHGVDQNKVKKPLDTIECIKVIYDAANKKPEVIAGIIENELVHFEKLHSNYEYHTQKHANGMYGSVIITFILKRK